jgi:excinuclease ABC subunit B
MSPCRRSAACTPATAAVAHGFRLPSALDNRPLKFPEWEELCGQLLFVSATPSAYEAENETARIEQLVRPTGIIDPPVSVRPTAGQVDDLIHEVKARVAKDQRAIVTTLTKRLAEDLSEYLTEAGIATTYLHSDIDAIERIEILQQLRSGATQCVIGVNLLREGLDLPEVGLVAIFDADKQGFLRSQTSLIQTIGRAARNVDGVVVLYADTESPAMRAAISETDRRRAYQVAYNTEHGIIPRSALKQGDFGSSFAEQLASRKAASGGVAYDGSILTLADIAELTTKMVAAAEDLRFEEAARLRDTIKRIESEGSAPSGDEPGAKGRKRGARRRRR